LLDCLRSALDAVDARRCVMHELQRQPLTGDWHVVALGKAAAHGDSLTGDVETANRWIGLVHGFQ